MEIHPDDILTFKEVSEQMWRVAKKYDLPLRSISGLPMPRSGMADRMGDCNASGHIRLVLRCTVDGQWCEEPLSPGEIRKTAAHELAHLRHLNHGQDFFDLCEELETAMLNQAEDHRAKILKKLVKMQASRQSEAAIGNAEAAEAFAAMINKMLIEYELSPSDLDYARATDDDPVVEIGTDLEHYGIDKSKVRIAWQEQLASHVAAAHLCTILISPHGNRVWFVGTRSHATVAEYVYGTMVPLIAKMSKQAEVKYWRETGCGRGRENKALGYRNSWINAFVQRIWERFAEARRTAVAEAVAKQALSNETALIRLDGALVKVRKYIEDKFGHHRSAARYANALGRRAGSHAAGREAGRAAADSITLGRRGVTGSVGPKKLLGD